MLIVHNPKTTDFNNYGKGILDKVVLRGILTHKINSACTITLDLIKGDITGDIMKEDIIVAPTPFGNQPFRVFDINPLGADRVEVVARHVFFDLQKRIVKRCKVDNANGQTILTKYLANLDKPVPHKLYSNITETASLDWQLKQGVDILLGDEENSFVNKLGGELRVDGFNAYIDRQIGRDRGFTARFRKNITGFTGKTTVDGLITRIIPKGFDGITLENDGYVDSTLIGNYSEIYTSVIEFPDVKYSQSPNNSNKEGFATLEEARAELIKRAKAYFEESGCDLPRSSFNINLIMLKDMVEYRDIAITEEIQLGDTITVDYTPYNLKLQKRLTGYTYNLLTQRMETLEIGDFGKDYFKELSNKIDKIEMPDFEEIKGGLEQDFQDKLEEFTDNLINGGNGSYVKFKPNFQNPSEILIMDNQDESKAKNVIRLNKEGIGASTTGVTGTYYGLAKDGKLIITEATANVIVASLIKGGMLQSNDGSTWINMDDGTFSFKNKINFDGDKLSIILDDGNTIEQKITGAIETANGFTAEKVSEIKSDINGVTLKVSNVEKSLSTTNGNLSSLTERVSEAESKITESAIINTVSSAINTAKNEAINSANSSTDNKLKGYVTQSTLTQTAENITAKFTSSGGVNLVRNGDFKNGTSNWWTSEYYPDSTNRHYEVRDDNSEWVLSGTRAAVIRGSWLSTGEQRWDCAKFPVKANTTYTLSFLISSHRTSRIGVHVRGNEWEILNSHSEDIWGQGYSGGKDRSLWKKFVLTFNSGNNYQANVNIMMLESQDDGYVWFTEVMVNEGDQPIPFTPHSEELVNGSTVIDASGVTVNNGALRVKNNSGQTVLSGDSEGNLWVQNTLTVGGDNNGSVFIKNSSGTPIFSANKNGTFIKDGTMRISNGSITTSGTDYPDGNTRDTTLFAYGSYISEVDYNGSQIHKRSAKYQGGHMTVEEDNTGNAGGISYRNYQTPTRLRLQKSGGGNLNYADTIVMQGDTGEIQCSTLRVTSNATGKNILIGDDCWLGDTDIANCIRVTGQNNNAYGYLKFGDGAKVGYGGGTAFDILSSAYVGGTLVAEDLIRTRKRMQIWTTHPYIEFCSENGDRRGYVGFEAGKDTDLFIASEKNLYVSITGHLVPTHTTRYWVGTNTPDRKWKGLCAEGGTVGSSDIRQKENIERLDGSIVAYDEVREEIHEYQLAHFRIHERATQKDYYEFIKDRFKPTYYNYKLSEVTDSEGEYSIPPETEYDMLRNIGFLAQDYDIENDLVAKEFIIKDEDGNLSYNHMSYVTVGMIALQEATKKIESLEQENQELKDRLDKLENLVQSIVNK